MPKSNPHESVRKVAAWALAALFLGVLWLPVLESYFGWDHAPITNENRAPAKFPALNLSWAGVRVLPAELEAYYNDHFGFRNRLIRWERKWKNEWFHEARQADALVGRDGWLYFSGNRMIDNYRAVRPFTPAELADWQTLLERRRDWLAQRGIKYLFVVPPDKQTIYPEHLPAWLTRSGPQTRYSQFLTHMRTHSTVPILDLRPVLRIAKSTMPTYQNTDAHWNYYGAFLAYQEVIRALAAYFPDRQPLPREAFDITVEKRRGGDLAGMLGQQSAYPETSWVEMVLRPPWRPLNIITEPTTPPTPTAPVSTENPAQTRRLVMFRDSFAIYWYPFFGHNFQRVVYLWQPHWDCARLERERPDVVVDAMLERFLCDNDPRELRRLDQLP